MGALNAWSRVSARRLVGAAANSRPIAGSSRAPALSAYTACRACLRRSRLAPTTTPKRFFHAGSRLRADESGHSSLEAGEGSGRGSASSLYDLDSFPQRHIGPDSAERDAMLKALDPPAETLAQFIDQVIPADVRSSNELTIAGLNSEGTPGASSEYALQKKLTSMLGENALKQSFIGCGYADTIVPEVIKRNVLESPAWYTSYTPYQPEVSQGRLESLLNFQTLSSDLTGLSISNASLLDEATAAAEAMTLSMNALPMKRQNSPNKTFLVSHKVHPQTIAVLHSRADGFGINIVVGDVLADSGKLVKDTGEELIGVLAQYPDTEGGAYDFSGLADDIHKLGATFSVATDLLALTVLKPPGEFGADIAFGNAQRLGVPFGFGGPHAAFFACSDKYKRKIPGRLVGVSKDRNGSRALRLALQTREQHIRREKATSNICTAQALLANMSAFYAIYHGPQGLKAIAERIVSMAQMLQVSLEELGFTISKAGTGPNGLVQFDTVVVEVGDLAPSIVEDAASTNDLNLRLVDSTKIGITLGESTNRATVGIILESFIKKSGKKDGEGRAEDHESWLVLPQEQQTSALQRTSPYLTHPVFNTHHSETEMLRYIYHLQSKDISLVHSMIPLGSCTMKLNGTTEMLALSNDKNVGIHPFAPLEQTRGTQKMIKQLEQDLARITHLPAVTVQPNSGAQGEFTGLRVIRKFHETQPGKKRDICLIPVSAHGTNPASAAMAGMRVVTIKCSPGTGNLDMEDLQAKCEKYSEELGAIMVTYPSTFGVFEPQIKEVCNLIHQHGGQVYMDGANMNAQIGLCSPGEIGADVCHLNLHKTFCIPHGGGGPGVGPIAVAEHLAPYLPGHPLVDMGIGEKASHPVSAAPWGSASILPISWAYIKLMGGDGLTRATELTLLNANYMLSRLKPHFPILYTNTNGRCAHEFILDVRGFKDSAGIEAIDVAKRLQDYGFHAPTMSWPVANTLMIEPTESESKSEIDRYCDALISIRGEIEAIEKGEKPRESNVLKMAPHTQQDLLGAEWQRPYSREEAAYPLPWLREKKFWPSVARLDDGEFCIPILVV